MEAIFIMIKDKRTEESVRLDIERYERFLDGDQQGFEELVVEHKDGLIYFIHRYIKDIDLAEDLAQDAFVEVFVHKGRYNKKTNFKTYLYTIGRNKAVDYIRKNKHIQLTDDIEEHQELSKDDELIDRMIRREKNEYVMKALEELKDDYAKAIMLVEFEELSYKEVATILDKSIPQIKVLIHRAKKALKKVLEEEGFTYEE